MISPDFLIVLGGVGLFLFGMTTLTDGLRSLANAPARRALARFTRTPLSGAVTGALTTAVIQSSSATTVTAVGFVGAGLLTFPQALGVIFGANFGTTLKGWIIALFGFRFELGVAAMPLLFVGVMASLLLKGKAAEIGRAVAGFSLLFIGLGMMQEGAAAFEGRFDPSDLPGDSWLGRAQLVGIGVAMTIITQSSSVGVAAALVALNAGAISFAQAAAMVIGMDVGTTFTAAMAALGGSSAMRQTGWAHVIYNVITGVAAFLLLDVYQAALRGWVEGGEKEFALVAFHSSFNFLGVVAVLPFADAFARLIQRLIPDHGAVIRGAPDERLLADPSAALDAATGALRGVAAALFAGLTNALGQPVPSAARLEARARRAQAPLEDLSAYVARIKPKNSGATQEQRLRRLLHVIDHLDRLEARFGQNQQVETMASDPRLLRLSRIMGRMAGEMTEEADLARLAQRLDRLHRILNRQRDGFRERRVARVSQGLLDAELAYDQMDAMRWLHRVCYHLWRIAHHLDGARFSSEPNADQRPVPGDDED